jgi:hypothetical protein
MASEVPWAASSLYPKKYTNDGITIIAPPNPNNPETMPAAAPNNIM